MLVLTPEGCEYVRQRGNGYVALRRSAKEQVVIEHRIASAYMLWRQGLPQPSGDHSKQLSVRTGAVGDVLAVTKPYEGKMTSTRASNRAHQCQANIATLTLALM